MLEMPELWTPAKDSCCQGVDAAQEKECAAVHKTERTGRAEEPFDVRHGGVELDCGLAWSSIYFLMTPSFLFLGMGMCIL